MECQFYDFDFDFDEWSVLARTDPEAFNSRRREVIEHSIECAIIDDCDDRRLHGLQCRIDLERMRARTPLKACLRLSDLMWDSLFELKDALEQAAAGKSPLPREHATAARIIPFRKTPIEN